MLAIDAPPAAIKEMERNIGINEDILRSLTVRVDELEEGPSAMMQQARSREEGYGGDTDIVTEAEERAERAN
jgi:small subunit ribosomal protein S6